MKTPRRVSPPLPADTSNFGGWLLEMLRVCDNPMLDDAFKVKTLRGSIERIYQDELESPAFGGGVK